MGDWGQWYAIDESCAGDGGGAVIWRFGSDCSRRYTGSNVGDNEGEEEYEDDRDRLNEVRMGSAGEALDASVRFAKLVPSSSYSPSYLVEVFRLFLLDLGGMKYGKGVSKRRRLRTPPSAAELVRLAWKVRSVG